RYSHVFSPDELALIATFKALPREWRMLYARLYLRRGPVFRVSRLEYAEVGDVDQALAGLGASGFATVAGEPADATYAVECLTTLALPELRAAAKGAALATGGLKSELLDRIAADPDSLRAALAIDRFVMLG